MDAEDLRARCEAAKVRAVRMQEEAAAAFAEADTLARLNRETLARLRELQLQEEGRRRGPPPPSPRRRRRGRGGSPSLPSGDARSSGRAASPSNDGTRHGGGFDEAPLLRGGRVRGKD